MPLQWVHSQWASSLWATKVVGHMKGWWYILPQWGQGSKVLRVLLRRGPGIDVPQPTEVDPVTGYLVSCSEHNKEPGLEL